MNSIYTAQQVKTYEKNSFINEGDALRAMMEAAKQSVEILNNTFSSYHNLFQYFYPYYML